MEDWETALRVLGGLRMHPLYSARIASFVAGFALALALTVSGRAFASADLQDVQITILQTTDLHHHANGADHVGLDVDPVGGTSATGAYSRIAGYVNYVRRTTQHPVLLVDSGDWTMGTLYDLTLGQRPLALYFLSFMHYDAATLGNHEFDYGPKGLAQIFSNAQNSFGFSTPIVASNMSLNGNTDLQPFFGPNKTIQTTLIQKLDQGITVGYIGLMGKAAASAAPSSAPVSFEDPASQYATIQALVDSLRNDQKADIVIALSHSGTDATGTSGEDVDLARRVTGIDVIASGHTHTPLSSARAITNGAWTTHIIDAGAFGTNVARIDLTYHGSSKTTTIDSSSSPAMTDAGLAAIDRGLTADPFFAAVVRKTDLQLNVALGAFLSQTFADYDPTKVGNGIYHPVGGTAQDMITNARDALPAPNGLGDLSADGVRAVTNGIIAQTLAAVGGNPGNLPGYDFTPIQLGVVASGVLRGTLRAGVPLTFADVYNVLPLGISADSTQALPVGYPLISGYMELDDMVKVCALQLVVQSGLADGDNYVNLSGIRYTLKSAETYAYFKYATAAGVLQVTSQKAAGGSVSAQAALSALSTLGSDGGAALLAAFAGGNPYAAAMVRLNDINPTSAQIGANLGAIGQSAVAAASGPNVLSALVVSKAIAAIDTVAGFAPTDSSNLGPAVNLAAGTRSRIAADLFAILSLGAVQAQFGTSITVYKAAAGPATLSAADFAGLLGNRVDASPAIGGIQEFKEWMSLLSYIGTGLNGFIGPSYASTSNFSQFENFGAAVQNRNATYPVAGIGQLAGTLGSLAAGQ
jgi:2',3'-cyclic-nucleotide 2'-phosphodiesterase (5'-nucleotidase family)